MEQLLLVPSCDSPAGIGASLRTDGRTDRRTNGQTDGRTNGWTHRLDVGNSILDVMKKCRQTFFIGNDFTEWVFTFLQTFQTVSKKGWIETFFFSFDHFY